MLIRFLLSFMVLVLVAGCAIPAKTKVTKDGFTARQKTTEAHRAVVEDYDVYRTDCRYDQLAKDKDGTDNQDQYDSADYVGHEAYALTLLQRATQATALQAVIAAHPGQFVTCIRTTGNVMQPNCTP